MTIYNGFRDNERREHSTTPAWDHDIEAYLSQRKGSRFLIRRGVRCKCGKEYWGNDSARAIRTWDAHATRERERAAQVPKTAWTRDESEPCQRGTVGCSVDHPATGPEADCATW